MSSLYYFHDPMCSWCWGFRPSWQALKQHLNKDIEVIYQVGGLAPDSDQAMPLEMRQQIEQIWHRIQSLLGTDFNFDFWKLCQPRRSTYPACRAVLAAQKQNRGEEMILAIQQAYYLKAQNPSDSGTLLASAREIGLDMELFSADVESEHIQHALLKQVSLAQQWQVPGFPGLVLLHENQPYSIAVNYQDYRPMLEHIESVMRGEVS